MKTLIELIEADDAAAAAAASGNFAAVAAELNAATIRKTDTTLRTARWIMTQLTGVVDPTTGATESDIVLGTLQAATVPRIKAAYDSLCSDGLDLSNDQIQAMVPRLAAAANWPAGLAEKVLSAGVWHVSAADENGLSPVTADDCAAAWERSQAIAAARELLARARDLVAARTTARQIAMQPLIDAETRDGELLALLTAQIATAENGGQLPTITAADVERQVG